jgi:hypothetical protein
MYDMACHVGKLRGSEKEKVDAQVKELHQHIPDMEHIIDQVQTECAVELGSPKKKVKDSTESMKKEYEDAIAAVVQLYKEIKSRWSR